MAETKYLDQTGLQHVLEGINTKFTKVGHKHTKADITDFAHTHDDRYYTETEINTKVNALNAAISGKADTTHTHKYAGSASAGGSANSAVKLDTATAGSATQPVYFADGKPVATTYMLNKTVPADAVFTDTNTHYASKNVVGSSTATANTTTALTNGNVYLNSVENGAVTSAHKISGSGATTVTPAATSLLALLIVHTLR